MRISDWSSDVCSSDLPYDAPHSPQSRLPDHALQQRDLWPYERPIFSDQPRRHDESFDALWLGRSPGAACSVRIGSGCALRRARLRRVEGVAECAAGGACAQRSDEHTSELPSLMLISLSVFCLNKNHTHE